MSYRRPNLDNLGSDRWRRQHQADLLRWLPAEVVSSQRALTYVLLHGEDHAGTGWTSDWLKPPEAAAFLAFLERECSVQTGYEIFRDLRRRANT